MLSVNWTLGIVIACNQTQFLTFCRPSSTVCRFRFNISSLDSYFILRSGTTAIRLKRISWYGSLKKSRAAAWEWSLKGDCKAKELLLEANWFRTHPAVASPILSIITRRALSVHSSSSPQGPEILWWVIVHLNSNFHKMSAQQQHSSFQFLKKLPYGEILLQKRHCFIQDAKNSRSVFVFSIDSQTTNEVIPEFRLYNWF